MNDVEAIAALEHSVGNARRGLPEEVFLFISRLTPMVNVDLLIKDKQRGTLLTWRDDEHFGPGWHIPGGIIRFKEKMADRVRAVAQHELGTEVEFDPTPLAVHEIILPDQQERAHFIALLFRCVLRAPLDETLRFKSGKPQRGQWAWHECWPKEIIDIHRIYEPFA